MTKFRNMTELSLRLRDDYNRFEISYHYGKGQFVVGLLDEPISKSQKFFDSWKEVKKWMDSLFSFETHNLDDFNCVAYLVKESDRLNKLYSNVYHEKQEIKQNLYKQNYQFSENAKEITILKEKLDILSKECDEITEENSALKEIFKKIQNFLDEFDW